jgi:hypothetical protein
MFRVTSQYQDSQGDHLDVSRLPKRGGTAQIARYLGRWSASAAARVEWLISPGF